MSNLALGSTFYLTFETVDLAGELMAPSEAFTADDIAIYRDGISKKQDTNGITVVSPRDGVDGKHLIAIETNEADAFWQSGAQYDVDLATDKTVDGTLLNGRSVPGGKFAVEFEHSRETVDLNPDQSGVTIGGLDDRTGFELSADGNTAITSEIPPALELAAIGVAVRDALPNLDAPVSSRLAGDDFVAAPTVQDIAGGLTIPTTDAIGQAVRTAMPEIDRLDVDVSSRLSAEVYVVPPSVAQIEAGLLNEGDGQQLIDGILQMINASLDLPSLQLAAIGDAVRNAIPELANLDASVSSRFASAGYVAAPTVAQMNAGLDIPRLSDISQAVRTALPEIDNLDVALSTRLAVEDYVAPTLKATDIVDPVSNDLGAVVELIQGLSQSIQVLADSGTPVNELVGQVWSHETPVDILDNTDDLLESGTPAGDLVQLIRTDLSPELERIDQPISAVQATVDADAIANQVVSNIPVSFVVSQTAKQVAPSTLASFVKATKKHLVYPLDANDEAIDTSDLSLEVVVESRKGVDLAVIVDADITKTDTFFSFTVPGSAHEKEGEFYWACRKTDSGEVISHGPYVVEYAAAKGG